MSQLEAITTSEIRQQIERLHRPVEELDRKLLAANAEDVTDLSPYRNERYRLLEPLEEFAKSHAMQVEQYPSSCWDMLQRLGFEFGGELYEKMLSLHQLFRPHNLIVLPHLYVVQSGFTLPPKQIFGLIPFWIKPKEGTLVDVVVCENPPTHDGLEKTQQYLGRLYGILPVQGTLIKEGPGKGKLY